MFSLHISLNKYIYPEGILFCIIINNFCNNYLYNLLVLYNLIVKPIKNDAKLLLHVSTSFPNLYEIYNRPIMSEKKEANI